MERFTRYTRSEFNRLPPEEKAKVPPWLKPKTSPILIIVCVILGVGILGAIINKVDPDRKIYNGDGAKAIRDSIKAVIPIASSNKDLIQPNAKPDNWEYDTTEEEMGRGKIISALCYSTNTVDFDFPYEGEQHARLIIRKHPEYGHQVIFLIDKGQFMAGVEGCNILVQFDNGHPSNYWALPPSDNSTTKVFISDYAEFVARLKNSKTVKMKTTFYNEGDRIFEFATDGFEWDNNHKANIPKSIIVKPSTNNSGNIPNNIRPN